jgi:hypothetical protein
MLEKINKNGEELTERRRFKKIAAASFERRERMLAWTEKKGMKE